MLYKIVMATESEQAPIPIVDFGQFLNGSQEEKERVAREIDDAFRTSGFVYLRNHGVEKEVVEEAFEWVSSMHTSRKI